MLIFVQHVLILGIACWYPSRTYFLLEVQASTAERIPFLLHLAEPIIVEAIILPWPVVKVMVHVVDVAAHGTARALNSIMCCCGKFVDLVCLKNHP